MVGITIHNHLPMQAPRGHGWRRRWTWLRRRGQGIVDPPGGTSPSLVGRSRQSRSRVLHLVGGLAEDVVDLVIQPPPAGGRGHGVLLLLVIGGGLVTAPLVLLGLVGIAVVVDVLGLCGGEQAVVKLPDHAVQEVQTGPHVVPFHCESQVVFRRRRPCII